MKQIFVCYELNGKTCDKIIPYNLIIDSEMRLNHLKQMLAGIIGIGRENKHKIVIINYQYINY